MAIANVTIKIEMMGDGGTRAYGLAARVFANGQPLGIINRWRTDHVHGGRVLLPAELRKLVKDAIDANLSLAAAREILMGESRQATMTGTLYGCCVYEGSSLCDFDPWSEAKTYTTGTVTPYMVAHDDRPAEHGIPINVSDIMAE